MSRQFFINEYLEFAPGGASGIVGGPATYAILWKPDAVTTNSLLQGRNASAQNVWWLNPYLDTHLYYTANGSTATSSYQAGRWYLSVVTKPAGNSTVHVDTYDYTATSWTHTDYSAVADSTNGPLSLLRLGKSASDVSSLVGKVAAVGLWTSVLAAGTILGLNASMSAWLATSPAWAVQLNQASTATNVVDLVSNGNQSAINGTWVSTDEPAGWSYFAGGPPVTLNGRPGGLRLGGHAGTIVPSAGLSDPQFLGPMTNLLTCLGQEVARTPRGAVKHQRITPGEVVVAAIAPNGVNECCEGIASVRLVRFHPTDHFPSEAIRAATEGGVTSWAVEVELHVIRCGKQPGPMQAPSDAALTADGTDLLNDWAAMRRAVCCLYDAGLVLDYVIGNGTPTQAEGGCIGVTLMATLQVECAECADGIN